MSARAPREPTAGADSGPASPYPLKLDGKVISGFGRGSKELGIPTANIPIDGLSVGGNDDVQSGVYFGWAGLSPPSKLEKSTSSIESSKPSDIPDEGAVFPMVMSIGWNPFYKNTVRSVEVHIMHQFKSDFYSSHMNLIILGFIRPELDYTTVEALIDDIKTDIDVARNSLAREAYAIFKKDSYLLKFDGKSDVAN